MDRLVVALDVPTLDEAESLARRLAGRVGWFKVGLELFSAHGPAAVEAIRTHGPVFLDVKLHDIPTTVERAARRIAELDVGLLTVHAAGGPAMVAAAVAGLGEHGQVLAVTVLTSMSDADLAAPTAWVFGNEAWGLHDADRDLADAVVRVPIRGRAESLNLAAAATVCLFASARAQRPAG